MLQHYQLFLEGADERGVEVFLLAGDLHNPLAGNKHLKLKPWLQRAATDRQRGLIGVGGVWSNFILSLALACRDAGLQSTGIIRGDEHLLAATDSGIWQAGPATPDSPPDSIEQITPTAMLQDAVAAGMQLHYVSRSNFRQRADPVWQHQWAARYPDYLWVPEGGSDLAAAAACAELVPQDFKATHWVVAAGTGASAAGVAAVIPVTDKLIVVNVSGDPKVETRIVEWSRKLRSQATAARFAPVAPDTRFGRLTPELCQVANQCFEQTGVLLDPVYTVKALQQVQAMIRDKAIAQGARVALLHTGGLQGWRGYVDKYREHLSREVISAINAIYPPV